jgi:carboxypeptidase Taq
VIFIYAIIYTIEDKIPMGPYQKLTALFKQLSSLENTKQILHWDEAVMMPEGAGMERAQMLVTLKALAQKLLITKKNKKLLEQAKLEGNLSTIDTANLKLMAEKYILTACIPQKLTEKITKASMKSEQAWRKLRSQNNWRDFMPYLTEVFRLTREIAERRGDVLQLSPYDAALHQFSPGFNQQSIDSIFSGLKQTIPAFIQEITKKQASQPLQIPRGPFAAAKQKQIGIKAMNALQFNFQHGRLDESHHPFCGGTANDVRITTRYNEEEFISSLMAVCHETGHGLYEQGIPRDLIDQPVGQIKSMAMHESQSLLMEMQVCSSKMFFKFLLPAIHELFGNQEAFTVDNMYHLATRIEPQLIRVNADEVTYQMHIILRYEIEKKLFNGELKIADLPAFWHESMMKYLGISTEGNFKDGVMQDVHWPCGLFGYFPSYSLGRLISAQLFATFIKSYPEFFKSVGVGNFEDLQRWLHANVYAYGASLSTNDLLLKVTGEPLNPDYFIKHVQHEYLSY